MNLRKQFWEWLSWGKDLEETPEIPIGDQSDPVIPPSDAQRNSALKAQILRLVELGYTLKLEQEFVAILELSRKRGYFLYFLVYFFVNVPLLIFFGILWLPIMILWTIGLIKRVSNRKVETFRLEVLPNGKVQLRKSS